MPIPKIIHYCWLGGAEKPASVLKCIDSWKRKCPDYEIKEWNENNLDINSNIYTFQAYEAEAWGFVPDFLRLWIIYNYGGVYLDTDVQILKPFDTLLNNHAFMGFENGTADENGMYVNCGQGFGAEAGNKVIKANMEVYDTLYFEREDGSYNRIPSPQFTTEVLKKWGLDNTKNITQDLGDIVIYPFDFFCPKNYTTGVIKKTKNTYSIHHFDASWFSEEEQSRREKNELRAKKDYYFHMPNRFIKKVLGDIAYNRIKRIFNK